MNIEENITEFKKMIERDKDTLHYWKNDTFGHYDEPIKKLEKDVLISETLLTAYEKEKEKNKKLEADIEMFTKKFDNESLECRIKQKIAKLNHYNSMYLISNGKYSKVIQKQIEILQEILKEREE